MRIEDEIGRNAEDSAHAVKRRMGDAHFAVLVAPKSLAGYAELLSHPHALASLPFERGEQRA
jgi:hypothetical protein